MTANVPRSSVLATMPLYVFSLYAHSEPILTRQSRSSANVSTTASPNAQHAALTTSPNSLYVSLALLSQNFHVPSKTETRFQPCPINPPTIPVPTATPSPPKCVCNHVSCPMIWPLSCHCANDGAKACYEKCGGEQPILEVRSITLASSLPSHRALQCLFVY
jgi:hypothetical protein